MSPHVIVVGAGPGGLSTALLLAGNGIRTTLLEAKDVAGGRMGRVVEQGYAFDTGPTILQLPQILMQIFERSGLKFEDYVTLDPITPNTRIHFWDGSHLDTFGDREKNRQEWERFVPGGAQRFDRFYDENAEKYEVAYDRFIGHDAHSIPSYFNPLRLLPAAKFMPWESLHRSTMRLVKDERLVYAMSYPSKYLGLHPTTCSSIFSVIAFLELGFGVWYPRGGFRALADTMLRAFRELGGTARMSSPVAQVTVDKGRATGVVLASGERIEADHVVVNADLALAKKKLIAPEHRRSYSDESFERRGYSCSTFMLFLGLDKVYREVPHHAIYLSNATRRVDRDALFDRALDEHDAPYYVCNPTLADPTSAPPGHSALCVLVPCPNTGNAVDWQAKKDAFADHVIERLAKVGLHDVKSHVRYKRIFTAETWRDDFYVFRGAVFNLSHSWLQLGPLRPKARDEDVAHLHWVGGGTHPGSGLITIFESANVAAADITARFGKRLPPSSAPRVGETLSPRLETEPLEHLLQAEA